MTFDYFFISLHQFHDSSVKLFAGNLQHIVRKLIWRNIWLIDLIFCIIGTWMWNAQFYNVLIWFLLWLKTQRIIFNSYSSYCCYLYFKYILMYSKMAKIPFFNDNIIDGEFRLIYCIWNRPPCKGLIIYLVVSGLILHSAWTTSFISEILN